MDRRSHTRQVLGSLLAAVLIVAVVITVVTIRLGPTSTAEIELQQERLKQQEDLQEERLKQQEDLQEERERGR
jgi:hypothetical protein